MYRTLLVLSWFGAVIAAIAEPQQTTTSVDGRVLKVLPFLLDERGDNTVSPSLFDRDAYQEYLRKHPDKVSGVRYDVLWKAKRAAFETITVRVELRGMFENKVPRAKTIEKTLDGRPSMRHWTELEMSGTDFGEFGKINAWRATLWCNGVLLDEYKSFLW